MADDGTSVHLFGRRLQGREDTVTERGEQVAALVRAIRGAHQSPSGYGGVVAFHVADIHAFAKRLVEQGVREELMRLERKYLGSATSRDSAAGARFAGFHVGLCRTLLAKMSEFATINPCRPTTRA